MRGGHPTLRPNATLPAEARDLVERELRQALDQLAEAHAALADSGWVMTPGAPASWSGHQLGLQVARRAALETAQTAALRAIGEAQRSGVDAQAVLATWRPATSLPSNERASPGGRRRASR